MAAGFLMTIAFEINLFGLILLLLCLVPKINAIGHFLVTTLFKVRVSNPFAEINSPWRGTVSALLALSGFAFVVMLFNVLQWYHRFAKVIDDPSARLQNLEQMGPRLRLERDTYIFAAQCCIFLALHTIARLLLDKETAAPSSPTAADKELVYGAPGARLSNVAADARASTKAKAE